MVLSDWKSHLTKVLWFSILLISGCDNDVTPGRIDPDFTDYVDRFVAEGNARGVKVDVSKLIIEFGTTPQGSVCEPLISGQHVIVSGYEGCWKNLTDLNREIIVFHALGHAILNRNHDDNRLPNSRPRSIMNSVYMLGSYIKYCPDLRVYYLDELFNSASPAPAWAQVKQHTKEIYVDSIAVGTPWVFSKSANLAHTGTLSTTYFSPGHSLSIQAITAGTSDQFSDWTKVLSPTGIDKGTEVWLKVRIKLVNVTASGVAIALRADVGSEVALFKTTQGTTNITGNINFVEYTVNFQYFPEQVDKISIFLIMFGQSTGTAYFDDISVLNYY